MLYLLSSPARETDQRSMADQITCPSCHFEFEISEVLASQLRDELRREYDAERRQLEHEFAGRQEDLRERTLALEAEKASLEQKIEARVSAERGRLEKVAGERARSEVAVELRDRQSQLEDLQARLLQAQKAELEVRQQARDIEQRRQELELSVA